MENYICLYNCFSGEYVVIKNSDNGDLYEIINHPNNRDLEFNIYFKSFEKDTSLDYINKTFTDMMDLDNLHKCKTTELN